MQRWILIAGSVLTLLLITVIILMSGPAKIGAAYKAKTLCSEIFVAGRDANTVAAVEFKELSPAFRFINHHIDDQRKTVNASLLGLGASRAIYREGFGCSLTSDGSHFIDTNKLSISKPSVSTPNEIPKTQNKFQEIETILDQAMADEAAAHRAFVILVDGKIVAERYAPGFTKDTPFLSWSMAKSVTATLIGAAADREYLTITDPAPVPEWSGDERVAITWRDLLRMESGLEFEEVYGAVGSDVNQMLFKSREMAEVAANQPALHPPGDVFNYSSGTSNLLARLLNETLKNHDHSLHSFAHEEIFSPIGATSFTLETDGSGNFVGSSYVYATARDWARLGQLYLQNGRWNDTKILSKDWVDFVKAPTEASDKFYGGHFWLNYDGLTGRRRWITGLPEDVYTMSGHEGQYVFIVPSKNMVIVRTGMTRGKPALSVSAPIIKTIYDAMERPANL